MEMRGASCGNDYENGGDSKAPNPKYVIKSKGG